MAATLRTKRSTGSTAPSSLANGEQAVTEANEIVYYGKGSGGAGGSATQVIKIGGKGAFFDKDTVRAANSVLAGPASGSDSAPDFRALQASDIPDLSASKITDLASSIQAQRLDQLASATSPISGVDPSADAHLATKGYVDGVAQGLDVKDSVQVATTANITLSGTQTIDGVAVSAGDRVLVKDQNTATENGIYVCAAGPWSRSADLANGASAAGVFTFVEQGSSFGDVGFVCSTNKGSDVINTNNIAFTQFSGVAGATAGNGLSKTGNEFAVDIKTNGGLVFESAKIGVDLAASSITGSLPISKVSGLTASAAELNALDGITASVNELNVLDGITANVTELNYVDGVTSAIQTQLNNKQPLNSDLTTLSSCQSGGATALSLLTSSEIGILDGATVSTSELNYVVGVTSSIQSQLDGKQGLDAQLTDIAGLSPSNGGFIVGDGSNFVLESGATARTSLGLGSMATQAANNVAITGGSIDGIELDGGSF